MKLFKTNNLETVTYCRMQINFDLSSTILKKRSNVLLENIRCVVTTISNGYYIIDDEIEQLLN